MYYQSLRLILIYSWCILLTTMLVSITYNSNMRLPTLCSFGVSSSPPTMTSNLQPMQLPEFNCRPMAIRAKTKNSSQVLKAWNSENIIIYFLFLEVGSRGNLLFKSKVSQDEKVSISVCLCQHVPPPKAAHAYRIFYFEGWY